MKFSTPIAIIATLWLATSGTHGFLANSRRTGTPAWVRSADSALHVSIGVGPDEKEVQRRDLLEPGVDYEIPNHEEYRLSRRSKFDEQCDEWYGNLLGQDNGILGPLAADARKIVSTTVPLNNEVRFGCRA